MSTSDSKASQHYNGALPQPVRAATSHHQVNFPPEYEEQVNDNMRNFAQLEGQIGNGSYTATISRGRPTHESRKYKIIIVLLSVALLGSIGFIAALLHNRPSSCKLPSQASSLQSRRTISTATEMITATELISIGYTHSAPTTFTLTKTTQSTATMEPAVRPTSSSTKTITSLSPTTLITTTTKSASVPSSVDRTAKSYLSEVQSLRSAILQSVESQLDHTSYPSSTLTKVVTTPPTTTTTTLSPTSTSSAETKTLGGTGLHGFCSVPGMFCTGGKRGLVARVFG